MYMEALGQPELAWLGWSFNFSDTETEKRSVDLTEELTDFCWLYLGQGMSIQDPLQK